MTVAIVALLALIFLALCLAVEHLDTISTNLRSLLQRDAIRNPIDLGDE